MQYYGAFCRSALHPLLQRINAYLMRWIRKKYKRLPGFKKADLVGPDDGGDHGVVGAVGSPRQLHMLSGRWA
jgi:hypothetical protein